MPQTKNVSDFAQKHFVSATNVSQFAQPKKHEGQQCVRNNVSSFAKAFRLTFFARTLGELTESALPLYCLTFLMS